MFKESGEALIAWRLGEEICTLAAHISAATCRFLELLAEFDEREGYSEWGSSTCAEWVSWRCSMAPVTAREHVRVARSLADFPLVAEAFSHGELSYSKVRAITRLDAVDNEAAVLEMAQHATASQLETILAAYRGVKIGQAAVAQRARYLEVVPGDDGSAVIRGRIPVEDAQLLLAALERADELLHADDASAEASDDVSASWGMRRADALIWLADSAAALQDGRTAGDRAQVVVHVDVGTLSASRCELEDSAPVAAETARRLCCDAGVVTIAERDGETLSVGRSTRSIPPAIRRALKARDGCCSFPGCRNTRWLDAHHVQHWAHGGATSLDNLVHLCHHHHQLVHEGGYSLARRPDGGCDVRTPSGRLLEPVPRARRGDCSAMLDRQRRHGCAPPPDALAPVGDQARYDLGLCVDALMGWTGCSSTPEVRAIHSVSARTSV